MYLGRVSLFSSASSEETEEIHSASFLYYRRCQKSGQRCRKSGQRCWKTLPPLPEVEK